MKKIIIITILASLSGCASIPSDRGVSTIHLDKPMAEKYALYAMMSSNAYLKSDRTYFPIEKLGWHKVDREGNPTTNNSFSGGISGLQFDIWEHDVKPKTVISFKGTAGKKDWLNNLAVIISPQYKKAKKEVKKYVEANRNRSIELTGHSLGGGLALSVSVWEGIDAYVFNSSPRIFDGIKNHDAPAIRKSIYQKGEILRAIRMKHKKFTKKIPASDRIQTNFNYGNVSKHRADYLAEGILRCATNLEAFNNIASLIPTKVSCNL